MEMEVVIGARELELLQFDKVKQLVKDHCVTPAAKLRCEELQPVAHLNGVMDDLLRTDAIRDILAGNGYFPSPEHEPHALELKKLALQGAMLSGDQLLKIRRGAEVANTMIRFLRTKKQTAPVLDALTNGTETCYEAVDAINAILDEEGLVKSNASPELARIRKAVGERRRESDRKFYNYLNELRKHGYLRDNEEGYYNGRRTIAVMVEHKSEVQGFVHGKSESGRTIFIEPSHVMGINNEIAELEIDEHHEVTRILRELCATLLPMAPVLRMGAELLVTVDFLRARALLAVKLNAVLPHINTDFELDIRQARHPLLFLQNNASGKKTVPLSVQLNKTQRILVISGPNAGGKTIALKTTGLLQAMLQSGLLVPAGEGSSFGFFSKILADIGDAQSIENELSTYSAKLKSMTGILESVNDSTLVLMDEFGSGTDPELGSAIAEAVLESLVASGTRGIITSHFGNVKVLAEHLKGSVNGSMLFSMETLEPRYELSVGEPGSSYTFEVAEKTGFPKHLIQRARQKVSQEKLRLSTLLAEVQDQKTRLREETDRAEHQTFVSKMAEEKYKALFNQWQERIEKEREKRMEQGKLIEFGQKYLRLMEEWNEKQDRKVVIKKFIDGVTAETKKKASVKYQEQQSKQAEKKIAKLKPKLQPGVKVRVMNSSQSGIVESLRDDKAVVQVGLLKMTVGIENLALAE